MSAPVAVKPGDRILVSRTDRIGDLVLALPLVASLKRRYPECRIEVCASLYASPILEHHPAIDGIVRVLPDQLRDSRAYRRDLRRTVSRTGYAMVVVLFPERDITRLFADAHIPVRMGTAGRVHSMLFTHRLWHSRKANRKHESEYNLDFLRFFRDGETSTQPTVHLTGVDRRNAQRIVAATRTNEPFVILHPGSGGSAESWPLGRFLDLYARLERSGVSVLFSGSDGEGEQIDRIASSRGMRVKKITGETDLRTLAAALSLASIVVANSTGPLHLAAAVGTSVVGLYPHRRAMSPTRWGPIGVRHTIVQPDRDQCDCPKGRCQCMETISADTVTDAVLSLGPRSESPSQERSA